MEEKSKQEIIKIKVTTQEKLDELYKGSALTFTGVTADEKSLKDIADWIKQYSNISNPLPVHIISGQVMNNNYHLTGENAYPKDLTLISIKLDDIENSNSISIPRFTVGGRWFDDIVDNNARREKEEDEEYE